VPRVEKHRKTHGTGADGARQKTTSSFGGASERRATVAYRITKKKNDKTRKMGIGNCVQLKGERKVDKSWEDAFFFVLLPFRNTVVRGR
jgi:hypothetical protein